MRNKKLPKRPRAIYKEALVLIMAGLLGDNAIATEINGIVHVNHAALRLALNLPPEPTSIDGQGAYAYDMYSRPLLKAEDAAQSIISTQVAYNYEPSAEDIILENLNKMFNARKHSK